MIIYLARHGETEWNRLGLLQGQLESNLTELGQTQAVELAQSLRDKNIEQIYSSSLIRAKDTAQICSEHLVKPVSLSGDLVERHFGSLQGRSFDELKQETKYQSLWSDSIAFEPEGGESASDSAKRFNLGLRSIVQQQDAEQILVVSHGDIIRNFLNQYLHQEQESKAELLTNGSWLAIRYCHLNDYFTPFAD